MQNSKNFKVNRSSAGSGKTYTLSLNFIALALIGSAKYSVEYYRKILAITFTNKAAAEMKDRVLEYLTRLPGIVICNCHAKMSTMDNGESKMLGKSCATFMSAQASKTLID